MLRDHALRQMAVDQLQMAETEALQDVRPACHLRHAPEDPEAYSVQQRMSSSGLSRERHGASQILGPPASLRRVQHVLHTEAKRRALLLVSLSAKVLSPIAFGARGGNLSAGLKH